MIKQNPELRHVLAHLELAIRSLAEGQPADALYELDQIHGLIYFDSDEEQAQLAKEIYGWRAKKGKGRASAVRGRSK